MLLNEIYRKVYRGTDALFLLRDGLKLCIRTV